MTPILKQSGELAIDLELNKVLSFSAHNMRGKYVKLLSLALNDCLKDYLIVMAQNLNTQ